MCPVNGVGVFCATGVDFINLTAFSRAKDERLFRRTVFGKQQTNLAINCANLSLKFGVLIVGKIEEHIFFAKRFSQAIFCLAKIVW